MRLSKYILAYLLITMVSIIEAQSFYKLIGTSGNDFADEVINDRDSGYVIIGGTEGLGQGVMDGYMVKLDTAGNVVWTRTFGGANVDMLTGVVLLNDGMLVSGYTNVGGDYQIYVVRTNEIGQVIWEKAFGNDNWEKPQAMCMINDSTVVIVGDVFEVGSTDKNALISAVTINGDSLWYHTYGGSLDDGLERVMLSDSNQIYVCGSYEVADNNTDYWVSRIDDQGNMLWEMMLGDTLNDQAHGITELITGEYIVTGEYESTSGTMLDNVFYKIDSSGNLIYQNVLNSSNDDIGVDVLSYPDTNSFILVSRSSSVGFGGFDAWVFDCNYYTFGAYSFSYSFGSVNDEWVVDADTTFDKGAVVVGNAWDDNLGNVIFVNKTNTAQNVLNTPQTEQDLDVEETNGAASIFPNPVSERVYLEGYEQFMGESYKILNLNGQVVSTGTIDRSFVMLDLIDGYYFLQISSSTWKFTVLNN